MPDVAAADIEDDEELYNAFTVSSPNPVFPPVIRMMIESVDADDAIVSIGLRYL